MIPYRYKQIESLMSKRRPKVPPHKIFTNYQGGNVFTEKEPGRLHLNPVIKVKASVMGYTGTEAHQTGCDENTELLLQYSCERWLT